jgi:hypothetical protein
MATGAPTVIRDGQDVLSPAAIALDPAAAELPPPGGIRELSKKPLEPLEPVQQIAQGFRSLASTLQLALHAVRETMPERYPAEAENPLENAPPLSIKLRLDWS